MSRVEQVVHHLLGRATWTYSRASGPGGQRRDHVETRAELAITADDLEGLGPRTRERLHEGLGLGRRDLRLRCGTERSREQNRTIVIGRLTARVAAALAAPPPPRVPTRPSRGAKERRLKAKRLRTERKASRRRVDEGAE